MFRRGRIRRPILWGGPFAGYLSLAVAYTISGKLALLLAVPPGYASPIFPPAGIAVAAMMIAGRATLPWTFLGAFLLNLVGHGSYETRLAAAFLIATASTLQAALGGTVLRRAIGEQDEALLEFRLLSQEIVDKVHSGLAEQEIFLEQLERSFSRPVAVSRADFRHLASSLLERFATIQAVKWAPRTDALQRMSFEETQQTELPGFEIREFDSSGQRRRAGERALYYPVTYVEPLHGNEHIVCFDLASEAGRKAAVQEAFNTRAATATPPIRLVQEQAEQAGILIIYAVHDGPNGAGVVSVALRMGTFVSELLTSVASMMSARLVDIGSNKPRYAGFSGGVGGPSYEDTFDFGGRYYRIETVPTASYLEQHRRWQSWVVLVAGVISTGLLGGLLLLGTGYTRRIEMVVDQRTRDLETVNRRLQLEVKERQQAKAALHQAQRMEAIGQLTGGIAHDFNNLLTVVSGNAALLLLHDKAPDGGVERRARTIIRAAEQGERLTRQLLAFSRRQMLRPESVDLRRRTHEIAEMLSQSLRENIDMVIEMPESL
jgi:signal transduction histidine kinase